MKTQTTIRVEEESYQNAKNILHKIGLNYSQAIGVFNNMVVLNQGLPFEVKIPNNTTQQALNEVAHKKGQSFANTEELFADLDD